MFELSDVCESNFVFHKLRAGVLWRQMQMLQISSPSHHRRLIFYIFTRIVDDSIAINCYAVFDMLKDSNFKELLCN